MEDDNPLAGDNPLESVLQVRSISCSPVSPCGAALILSPLPFLQQITVEVIENDNADVGLDIVSSNPKHCVSLFVF